MLGYYLDRSKNQSGWRRLGVKVKRDQAQVRARSGFFVTNATTDPEKSRTDDIALALQSPLDCTALALVGRWDNIEPGNEPGKKHVNYRLGLPSASSFINDADNNHVALELLAMAKTSKGEPTDHPVSQKIEGYLRPERVSAIRQRGIVFTGALDLAPGEYTVRFVVRDDLSGRIGSLAAPLKVE